MGYEKGLFCQMLAEGLIAESRSWDGDELADVVHFPYERFADHMIASHILDLHLPEQPGLATLGTDTPLGRLVGSDEAMWSRAGLIHAMSIQIPERCGKELIDIAPHILSSPVAQRAFIDSLSWRKSDAFFPATTRHITQMLRTEDGFGAIMHASLTVAAVPGHPLNADWLHGYLERLPMPDRDRRWSILLHWEYGNKGPVDRLVDWASGDAGRSIASEEVFLLAGTVIAWFFTSSNRFLRDRSTKAVVRLFEDRLPLLGRLLSGFWDVDDPYVFERLMAVAYGCALRANDLSGLPALAQEINTRISSATPRLPRS